MKSRLIIGKGSLEVNSVYKVCLSVLEKSVDGFVHMQAVNSVETLRGPKTFAA